MPDKSFSYKIASSVVNKIPNQVEEIVAPLYYYYNSKSADWNHQSPSTKYVKQDSAPEHVLVLIIDALRPDAEPDVDLEFGRAITPGSWTFPAITSLHTGQYPHEHGSIAHTPPEEEDHAIPKQYESRNTLAHVFESAGYSTYSGCAFIVPFLATNGWYEQNRVYADKSAQTVISDYLSWRRKHSRTFGYLHLGDLHNPIEPPSKYIDKHDIDTTMFLSEFGKWTDEYDGGEEAQRYRRERMKLYHAALDYVSDEVNKLIDEIQNDTMIVVGGDHGEPHFEHWQRDQRITDSRPSYGVGHGGTPFDELARVPVSIQTPDGETYLPEGGWGSLIDIPNTISALTIEQQPFGGQNWLSSIPADRAVFCEGARYGVERKAVYQKDEMAIRSKSDDVTFAGKVRNDSGVDFSADIDEDALISLLPQKWDDFEGRSKTGEFAKSQLKALGYTQ
ncbi:arylsulfatase A family protein [Halogeometricum borinquense DSM 11551]|uniref:Arylsulfatase A family protein n=1 Tax=Halogeometricum borinquense (strain ATCC 700274 / DSM 11551 / JCM 10706 / KCTC 4070 / PR3) TaxID=469382 RepID=E4NUH3_HALBP|nr:sulfatase-like hydrolase/transferase [Halogeometricum borinquense]ADQ68693.1 arylsulfatase A family protein [Halogeometricum borinquense DSM 11551]ELY25433.1 arylsulfatase A family protein [Halogeometricum borinquense DSM 11551]